MNEYIDREALLEDIENTLVFSGRPGHQNPKQMGARLVAQRIRCAPAADVAPAVHGRWEFDGSDFADIWKCSACGGDWYFEYDPRDAETLVKFCPNCGADMRGVNDE